MTAICSWEPCGMPIHSYTTTGRRTRRDARFCSDSCRQACWRATNLGRTSP